MKRPTVMSIGGATFDLFVRLAAGLPERRNSLCFPVGAKVNVEKIVETCGGGASNTAVGLARLGCDAAFCGVVGSDQWGERMLRNLRDERVDTSAATVVEGEISSSSIILSVPSGDRTILYNAGTNIHIHDATFDRAAAAMRDWLYLTHLQSGSQVILDDIIQILSDSKKKAGFTWNPGSTQITAGMQAPVNRALLAHARILLLNKEEALAFTETTTVEEALAALSDAGARWVVITDGARGALSTDGSTLYRCPPLPGVTVLDTTGAGDAFGTGVTWAFLRGKDLPAALQAGTILSASVLGSMGAQKGLLTDRDLQKRLSSPRLPVQAQRLR